MAHYKKLNTTGLGVQVGFISSFVGSWLWTLSAMTFNDVETLKKWPIVGGISTQSDGEFSEKP